MKRVILPLLFLFCFASAIAQDRCAFDFQQKAFLKKNPNNTQQRFENWLQQKMMERRALSTQGRTQAGPYKIPVVVHVIHNGEAVGTGSNISDAQILSQIAVLNKDYQRLNADATSTPSLFQSVAGSIDLEFVMAKQDPEGLPTNGIVRKRGTKSGWAIDPSSNKDVEFKYLSYWPAEDYLNIWVLNITNSFIGYAQFPETTLPGLAPPYDRLTDGVAVDYQTFGSIDYGTFNLHAQYNRGRTATHEVGHFLGLLHTFEGGCSGPNDYVNDTPALSEETTECPTHPQSSCGTVKMFQNYLDYTDDVCMNLFTVGQVARMTTILENSPRRKSLLTSHGLNPPVSLPLDLQALSVVAPETVTCSQSLNPKVKVRNRGTSVVTSARVAFTLNGVLKETKDFSLNLSNLSMETLSFTPITLVESSTNTVSYTIQLVNGGADGEPANNTIGSTATVKARLAPPFSESFSSLPNTWTVLNSDNGITWATTSAPSASSTNTSMYMDFFNYEQVSLKDQLVSPFVDLTQTPTAILKFDRAYARFSGNNDDSLRVLVYTDCQTVPETAFTIYNAGGTTLATTSDSNSTSQGFVPSNQNQWKTEALPLTAYLGKNIQFVFEATSGWGNNLYLDNVQVVTGAINDVAVTEVLSPEAVICTSNPKPKVTVQNLGSNTVTKLTVTPKVNGQALAAQTFTNLNITSGTSATLTLGSLTLQSGENSIEFTLTNPDVASDQFPANNTLAHNWVVNDSMERTPLRQNMNDLNGWTLFSPGNQTDWLQATTNFETSLLYPSFANTTKGQKAWLVSPVLDLTNTTKGSVLFDVSYKTRSNASENLKVMISEDCGVSYSNVLYTVSGNQLSIGSEDKSWLPGEESDWRTEYINLNDYAGREGLRLAFVATNDNGNNLYLDNIEFFVDDDPTPPRISSLYAVYSSDTDPYDFKITFKLAEKATTRVQVYSMLGQLVVDETLPETLNQTYTVNMTGRSSGIYVARLQVGNELSAFKLFVGK